MGGMFAAIGILAALQERHATGRGRSIKAGLFENNVLLMATHMMQFAVTGVAAAPMPERLAAWAVYDVFETADGGQVFIGVVSDTQWEAFCRAFKLDSLRQDPALGSNRSRVLARERFMPVLRDLFAGMDRNDVLAACEAIGLPFAPINRPEDLIHDPHLAHPGAMVPITLPDGQAARAPALPLEWDGQRFGLRRDIPHAGEDTEAVARELGLDDEMIATLRADGVLGG
jgi:crotonobetainyl-CoA:carnitine CoA-transferase CaiB-like acyl-CoA transferase